MVAYGNSNPQSPRTPATGTAAESPGLAGSEPSGYQSALLSGRPRSVSDRRRPNRSCQPNSTIRTDLDRFGHDNRAQNDGLAERDDKADYRSDSTSSARSPSGSAAARRSAGRR